MKPRMQLKTCYFIIFSSEAPTIPSRFPSVGLKASGSGNLTAGFVGPVGFVPTNIVGTISDQGFETLRDYRVKARKYAISPKTFAANATYTSADSRGLSILRFPLFAITT
jgi:hypothetical protein